MAGTSFVKNDSLFCSECIRRIASALAVTTLIRGLVSVGIEAAHRLVDGTENTGSGARQMAGISRCCKGTGGTVFQVLDSCTCFCGA
jgi:hypothetical protein